MNNHLVSQLKRFLPLLASLLLATEAGARQMKDGPVMTRWDRLIGTNAPLREYPRPQMVRTNWLTLNGIWKFQAGVTNTDAVPTNQTLSSQILVPYPMESAISGVMHYRSEERRVGKECR